VPSSDRAVAAGQGRFCRSRSFHRPAASCIFRATLEAGNPHSIQQDSGGVRRKNLSDEDLEFSIIASVTSPSFLWRAISQRAALVHGGGSNDRDRLRRLSAPSIYRA
jgi:hypothetical protein